MKFWGKSFVRPAVGLRKYFEIDLINTAALKLMLTPAVGLRLILIYKYSGCKRNEMWGKSLLRPAVGLRQIWTIWTIL